MVAVQISGGLGNQILLYAIGRGIANIRNDEPVLETSFYLRKNRRGHEEFALHEYPLKYNRVLTEKDLFSKFGWVYPNGKLRTLKRVYNAVQLRRMKNQFFPNPRILSNENMDFVNNTCDIKGDIFIVGYPFHLKFFEHIADELRGEFIPKHIAPKIAEQASAMDKHSVSVHVRITDSGKAAIADYYINAAAWITERVPNPIFYVFSNNPKQARECINFSGKVIFIEAMDAVQDLYLMSCCRHHIVAESTFSWCGAWLSGKDDRYILYPQGWMAEVVASTIIPSGWVPIGGIAYR